MRDAVQEALAFSRGMTRQDLDRDRMLTLALVRCLEIVGEAASKVSPETRGRAPEMPWTDLIGMRNRLIHAYFEIDLDRLWDTLTRDLPPLKAQLDTIVSAGDR